MFPFLVFSMPIPTSNQTSDFVDFASQTSLDWGHSLQPSSTVLDHAVIASYLAYPSSLLTELLHPGFPPSKTVPIGFETNLTLSLLKPFSGAPMSQTLHDLAAACFLPLDVTLGATPTNAQLPEATLPVSLLAQL